jgi:predicted DNA-binding transcriptional regulator YafY
VDSSSSSPTAKVLRTLELVQTRPGITVDDVAQRLAVSDRAVRRYVAILREAGVPVESVRGRYGGYQLGRSLQPPPLMFTASEALGLVMAVLDGHHAAADPDDPVGSALGKLIRSLPSHTGRQAAMVREHARAAPDRNAARPDPSVTAVLVEAVANRRGIRIGYTSGAGSSRETRVDPWAIVVRHGRWYLLCLAYEADAARAYRIDRIDRVDVLNVDIEPPADLNPVMWLETHLGTGWKYPTCVEFAAPFDVIAPHITPPMGQLEPSRGGTCCILRGTTSNPTMYAAEWLAAIPHRFQVLDGPELREAVTEVGRRMLDAVSSPNPSLPLGDR